jgi:hypothetical protein
MIFSRSPATVVAVRSMSFRMRFLQVRYVKDLTSLIVKVAAVESDDIVVAFAERKQVL